MPKDEKRKTSWLETAATIVSLVLIAAVVGILLWEAAQKDSPPVLESKAAGIRRSGEQFYVSVEVKNEGRQTAREVQVRGELKSGEEKADEAEATIDWIAGKSKRHATLVFSEDPTSYTLETSIAGYDEP